MKILRKKIFVIVALALMVSSVFTGFRISEVSAADEATQTIKIPLVNPGFEDAIGADGKIPGWNVNYTASANVSHAVSTEQVKSGNSSLHLHDNSNSETIMITSEKYEIVAGKVYTLSTQIAPNKPSNYSSGSIGGSIYINYYNENGEEVKATSKNRADYPTADKFGIFAPLSLMLEAPEGAKYITVSAAVTVAWVGDTYFDDFQLTYEAPTTTPNPTPQDGMIPMVNVGFEDEVSSDGEIPGWTVSYTATASTYHELDDSFAYEGTHSLKISDLVTSANVLLTSNDYAIEEGVEYTASSMMYLEDPTVAASLLLRFVDINGNEIPGVEGLFHFRSPKNEWFEGEVKAVAPAGAKYARVYASVSNFFQAVAYYDNFKITYEVPEVPEVPEIPGDTEVSDGSPITVEVPIPNAGFEDPVGSDGLIPGWRQWWVPTENAKYELTTEKKYAGNYSVKIIDSVENAGVILESDKLAVKAGVEYNASVMLYMEDPTTAASLLLRFYDVNDKQIGAEGLFHFRSPKNEWFQGDVKAIAPDNVSYARVFASVSNFFKAVAYYDDFKLTYQQEGMTPSLVAPDNVVKNQSFTAQLGANHAVNLNAAKLSLAYDTSALEILDVTIHPDFTSSQAGSITWTNENGLLTIQAAQPGNNVVSGNVGIANVEFKVLNKPGNTVLSLKSSSILTSINGGNSSSVTFTSDVKARMTIMLSLEDVNHDGVVSLLDLLLVAKNVDKALDSTTKNYDVNGDGKLDAVDVTLLAQSLADN